MHGGADGSGASVLDATKNEDRTSGADQPKEQRGADGDIAGSEDPYELLRISAEASIAEIKSAYRNAIKLSHPDTVADRSMAIKKAAEQEAQQINSPERAEELLSAFDAAPRDYPF